MDHDSFLNNLIEHSELYKNFTEKDLKKFSEDDKKDLIKLFMDDKHKILSKYFD